MQRIDPDSRSDVLKADEVRDDRGDIVKMAPASTIHRSPLTRVPEFQPMMDRIVLIRWPLSRDMEGLLKGVALLSVIGAAVSIAVGVLVSVPAGLAVVAAVYLSSFIWALRRGRTPIDEEAREHYVAAVTRHAICPTCLSDLAACTPDDDGTVRCVGCGSSWRTDRFERVEPYDIPRHTGFDLQRKLTGASHGQLMRKAVRDARGRWVALAEPQSRMIRRRYTDPEHRRRIRNATRRSKRVGRAGRGFLTAVAALVVLVFLIPPGGGTGGGANYTGFSWTLANLPFALLIIFLGRSIAIGRMGVPADRIVNDALHEGLCPSCWSDLRSEHADREREAECPSCGASWSMDEHA